MMKTLSLGLGNKVTLLSGCDLRGRSAPSPGIVLSMQASVSRGLYTWFTDVVSSLRFASHQRMQEVLVRHAQTA